jgi:hypothetical protein
METATNAVSSRATAPELRRHDVDPVYEGVVRDQQPVARATRPVLSDNDPASAER